jgi:Bacterial regulatory proteins, lacI family
MRSLSRSTEPHPTEIVSRLRHLLLELVPGGRRSSCRPVSPSFEGCQWGKRDAVAMKALSLTKAAKAAKIYQVAQRAGASIATVSRALLESAPVTEVTGAGSRR